MSNYQGIYKIRNLLNGKVYIGQSSRLNHRFSQHKNEVKNCNNVSIYNAIRKYGIDNFEFIIIEWINDINKLNEREQYWMDYSKAYNPEFGYNIRCIAESMRGFKHSEET